MSIFNRILDCMTHVQEKHGNIRGFEIGPSVWAKIREEFVNEEIKRWRENAFRSLCESHSFAFANKTARYLFGRPIVFCESLGDKIAILCGERMGEFVTFSLEELMNDEEAAVPGR